MTVAPGPPPPQQPPQTIVVPGTGWVDVGARVVTQVGFPIVVAGVLLWFILGKFQSTMDQITSRMAANTEVATGLVKAMEMESVELRTQTEELKKQTAQITRLVDIRERELRGAPH